MLQQTRVDAVVPYYERFLRIFPDVYELAAASEEEVLQMWAGLGYYRRAKMLHQAAMVVSERRQGAFPRTRKEWKELPGIGEYTSAAIASIAYGEAVGVVDGNVKRVVARVKALKLRANDRALHQAADVWMEERLGELKPEESPGDFNQAVMELGATLCTPKNPSCAECPILETCASSDGLAGDLPLPAKRKEMKKYHLSFLVAHSGGRFLLRPCEGNWNKGLWEPPSFPETTEDELQEKWKKAGGEGTVGSAIGEVRHTITHHQIRATLFQLKGVPKSALRDPSEVPLSGLGRKVLKIPKSFTVKG